MSERPSTPSPFESMNVQQAAYFFAHVFLTAILLQDVLGDAVPRERIRELAESKLEKLYAGKLILEIAPFGVAIDEQLNNPLFPVYVRRHLHELLHG